MHVQLIAGVIYSAADQEGLAQLSLGNCHLELRGAGTGDQVSPTLPHVLAVQVQEICAIGLRNRIQGHAYSFLLEAEQTHFYNKVIGEVKKNFSGR